MSLGIIFTEDSKLASITAFLIILGMAITGIYARKYGLPSFKLYRFSKPLAIFSLFFGSLFIVLVPTIFARLYGLNGSFKAIITLLIMFIPVVIASIAILVSKSEKLTQTESFN